jgi:hypothetical protein
MLLADACTGGGAGGSSGSQSESPVAAGNSKVPVSSSSSTRVPGQNYQICAEPQYLTSPWTYHALAKGSQSYTVAQYESLAGYGKILPPLPAYIAAESPTTTAAVIYAPGSGTVVEAYSLPGTPVLQFFEGGAYGKISMQSVTGDEFIGGSAPGYPEPAFNDGGGQLGIQSGNDTFDYSGGTSTLASPAAAGAARITTRTAIPGYISYVTFPDGSTYKISGASGTIITLASKLTQAEPADTQVWANTQPPIALLASAAGQGATTITLTSSAVPLLPTGRVVLGADSYMVTAVSGAQSGYQVGIAGLDAPAGAKTPVYYDGQAGDVTVAYLDISNDRRSTGGTISTGSGWTIVHNNIHDGNGAPGVGTAIANADRSTIEYNCLARMGDYGLNIAGVDIKFDYNEIFATNDNKDAGCGCSGGGKWWGTLNADIVDNSFINDGPAGGFAVWLDNGNSGTLIQGNFFYKDYASGIESETGFNLKIADNLFMDGGWGSGTGACDGSCAAAVDINTSGGFTVPGSRFENSVTISGNQFINDWKSVDIWQSGERSCEYSGEGGSAPGTDAPYCSGGFPNTATTASGGQYYFSHAGDGAHGGGTSLLEQPAAAGSTQLLVQGAEAINDQIGFGDPSVTKTGARGDVGTLKGAGGSLSATTKGFPSSGELRVGTSAAWGDGQGSYTGAVLAYTGVTPSSFLGVTVVRGSGKLAGPVEEVQRYRVTAEKCFANDCLLTVSPPLASAEAAGVTVTNAGTCQLYATSAALPSGPLAPDGVSYWDGCQWEARDISVTGNDFVFQPSVIAASAPVTGGKRTSCTAAHPNDCGTNFMGYQDGGELPFSYQIGGNAMMSRPSLTGCPVWDAHCATNPLKNLNELAAPPGAPAGNGELPYNNVWSGNSYRGPWAWKVYIAGDCGPLPTDSLTGKSMPAFACTPNFAQWQSIWQQDLNSTARSSLSEVTEWHSCTCVVDVATAVADRPSPVFPAKACPVD